MRVPPLFKHQHGGGRAPNPGQPVVPPKPQAVAGDTHEGLEMEAGPLTVNSTPIGCDRFLSRFERGSGPSTTR